MVFASSVQKQESHRLSHKTFLSRTRVSPSRFNSCVLSLSPPSPARASELRLGRPVVTPTSDNITATVSLLCCLEKRFHYFFLSLSGNANRLTLGPCAATGTRRGSRLMGPGWDEEEEEEEGPRPRAGEEEEGRPRGRPWWPPPPPPRGRRQL